MANAGELSVQLKADDQASKKIEGASKNMSKSFTRIKNGAAIASAAVLGAFGVAINNFLETGDALHKMSGRMDMSVRTIEALSHAAGLAGQDISLFENVIKMHTKNLLGLSEGTQVVTDNYAELGFTFAQLDVMPMEDQIISLLGAMADLDDTTQRNTLGIDIFKGAWAPVKNLIQDTSSTAIKDLIARLKETGFWTDETAGEAAVLNDTLADSKRVLGLVVLELVRGHIPAMQLAASKLLLFVTENKESIKQVASNILTLAKFIAIMKVGAIIITAFTRAFVFTKIAIQTTIGILLFFKKVLTTTYAWVKIKAGIMIVYGKAVLYTTTVMNGLRKAVMLARVATMLFYTTAIAPLIPFLAGIGAVLAVIVSTLATLEVITKGGVTRAFKSFKDLVKSLGDKLGFLKTAWEAIVDKLTPFTDKVKETASVVKDKLVPSFEAVTDEAAETSDIMKQLKSDFGDFALEVPDVTEVVDETKTALDKLNEALTTNVGAIGGVTVMGEHLVEGFQHTSIALAEQADAAEDARISWEAYHRGIMKVVAAHRALGVPTGPYSELAEFPSVKDSGAVSSFLSAVAMLITAGGGQVTPASLKAKALELNPFGQGFGEFGGTNPIINYFNTTTGAGVADLLSAAANNGVVVEGLN